MFLDRLVPLSTRAEKRLIRARAAEKRSDFDTAAEFYAQAAELYSQLLEKKRGNLSTKDLVRAGLVFVRTNRNTQAKELLEQALDNDPSIPEALALAGYAAMSIDDREAAARHWGNYSGDPSDAALAETLHDLSRAILSPNPPSREKACEKAAFAMLERDRLQIQERMKVAKRRNPGRDILP